MAEHEPKKSNYFPIWFYVASAATNSSSIEMSIAGEATATDCAQQPIPWAGSIVGMSLQSEAVVGAGTATVYPTINGVTAASSLVLSTTHTQYTAAAWRRGQYTFTKNQRLGAQYTTTATYTAGVTQSLVACVWVHVEEN